MLSLLRLESKHKNYSNPLRIRIFLFLSFSFGIEMINTFIHSVVPSKTIPAFRPKRPKTLPDGTAHTHMAYIREHPPPPPHLLPGCASVLKLVLLTKNYAGGKTG